MWRKTLLVIIFTYNIDCENSVIEICYSKAVFDLRYHLEIGEDGSYKPSSGYNHHVHPRPHPTFDTVEESFEFPKLKSIHSKPSKMGLFKDDIIIDKFRRKPFYVSSPTVSHCYTFNIH